MGLGDRCAVMLLLGLLLIVAGCGGRSCPACNPTSAVRADPCVIHDGSTLATTLTEVFRFRPGPKTLLLLSGGGGKGAWGAGVLKGWTERGDRPTFDVVTGVSTGAMIATFAFLGKTFDPELERAYTTMSSDDVFRDRFLPFALLFSTSLKDTRPLERLIADYFPDAVIDQVGRAWEAQRRTVLVATVDFDTGGFVVWDLGRCAASDRPDRHALYRRVLLAATAFPIVFPPVTIEGAMHVDGGVREQIFGRRLGEAWADAALRQTVPVPPTAYLIVNGQLTVPRECVSAQIFPIGLRTVSVMMLGGVIGNLYEIRTRLHDWDLRLSRIPDDYPLHPATQLFDTPSMRELFVAGYAWGKAAPWERIPDTSALSPLPCSH
jgi:hypothetical protein